MDLLTVCWLNVVPIPCSHFCQKIISASVIKSLNRPVSNVVLLPDWTQLFELNLTSGRAKLACSTNSWIINTLEYILKVHQTAFFYMYFLFSSTAILSDWVKFDTTETSQFSTAVARRLKQSLPNIVACSPLSRSHTTLETGSVLSYWRKEWVHLEMLVLGSVRTVRLGRLNCSASSWLKLLITLLSNVLTVRNTVYGEITHN